VLSRSEQISEGVIGNAAWWSDVLYLIFSDRMIPMADWISRVGIERYRKILSPCVGVF
jgi:hypothetical protein